MPHDVAPPVPYRPVRTLLVRLATLALCVIGLLSGSPPVSAAAGAVPVGVWPLVPQPPVVRGFDPPDVRWGAGHRGVDLLGRPGQPVRSALPGRVSWSGVLAGRGVVVVDHGTTRTTYEPLDARAGVGTVVAAGDRIGRLATLGSHCAPRSCLHWGWIEDDTYLDPLRLVGAGPIRLLPLWQDRPAGSPTAGAPLLASAAATLSPGPQAVTPYAAWRPLVAAALVPLVQARGWACW
jgi:murein DD-endopeptidase MepM/ murein hydrolase activator NlpD